MRRAVRNLTDGWVCWTPSNLRVEQYGLPMHVAELVILDTGPLLDTAGGLRLDATRKHIEQGTSGLWAPPGVRLSAARTLGVGRL